MWRERGQEPSGNVQHIAAVQEHSPIAQWELGRAPVQSDRNWQGPSQQKWPDSHHTYFPERAGIVAPENEFVMYLYNIIMQ